MKVTILQEDLSKLLSISSRFVSLRAQLPVLANIKLTASGAKLTLNATNLEMSISAKLGAKIDEEGDITLPSRIFTDLISTLPKGQVVLETKKETLNVSSEQVRANVAGMNSSDFPDVPNQIPEKALLLKSKDVLKALNQVLFSTSMDDTRPALAGVLLIFDKRKISFVSSDGFRLSKKDISVDSNLNVQKLIIPKAILIELTKIVTEDKVGFYFDKEANQVIFSTGSIVVSSRVIDGEYPNFERIIPTSSKVNVSVDKNDFSSAVKRSAIFAREGANIAKIETGTNIIKVSAESSASGGQESVLDAKVDGGEVVISYNYRYLEDFLSICDSDTVEISLIDAISPGVFKEAGESSYLHLIMPVKN